MIGTLAGLLHGPFTVGVPLSRSLDTTLLGQTLRTRFGAVWVVPVLLLVGVLHLSAVAVWFGSLILLKTCVLPRPDVKLVKALPRFSSVAFGAMVVIVMTGIAQNWRQLGSPQALAHAMYGRLLVGRVAVFLLLMGFAGYSRALDARVPASWVTADEAYGGDPALRGVVCAGGQADRAVGDPRSGRAGAGKRRAAGRCHAS